MPTLQDILSATRMMATVSELRQPKARHSTMMGANIGGRAEERAPLGGHSTEWDVFNTTREVVGYRHPETPPHEDQLDPVAHRTATLFRSYESRQLSADRIWNNRMIGGSTNEVDKGGVDYINRQEKNLSQKFANSREWATVLACRGKIGTLRTGSGANAEIIPVDPELGIDGTVEIDFGVSADHLGNCGGIIAGPWSNPSTKIVSQLLNLRAQGEQDTGYPIQRGFIDSTVWGYLINNTQVQTLAGSSNPAWTRVERVVDRGPENEPINEWRGILTAIPDIEWTISDHGLNVPNTATTRSFQKMYKSDRCLLTPDETTDWFSMHIGSEPVKDDHMSPIVERFGFYAYSMENLKPTGYEMLMLDNYLPVLLVPDAIFYPDITQT